MESPLHLGDITTNSIQNRLHETHLGSTCSSMINSAVYSGQRVIQLTLNLQIGDNEASGSDNSNGNSHQISGGYALTILRRVKDSYINVSQLFAILVKLGHFSPLQVDNYFKNEILSNIQYHGTSTSHVQYNDLRSHDNYVLQGLWIPYDKAVGLALKFDIYDFVKKLFLIDVHDFDKLPPKSAKRLYEDDDDDQTASLMGSPTKRQKKEDDKEVEKTTSAPETSNSLASGSSLKSTITKISAANPNLPYTLPPILKYNEDISTELKIKLGESFKLDDENSSNLSFKEISAIFHPLLANYSPALVSDIPLDQKGQTALHFAATLASSVLISSFIELGISSPIRGNLNGESPLISTVQVTNSMEKGNFSQILSSWLFPNIWLLDSKKWTILHHLTAQAKKKYDSSKFYFKKIVEYIISDEKLLKELIEKLINAKDEENGNTALHLAAEYELTWFIKVLVLLKADVNITNNAGTKPVDFEIVKDVVNSLKVEEGEEIPNVASEEEDVHLFELIGTSLEFLEKRLQVNESIEETEEVRDLTDLKVQKEEADEAAVKSSDKIFQSIQNLLKNTNYEYETILNSKRQQIKNLNQAVNDAVIVTANNRFVTKKISEKLVLLDTLKLQISNIREKLGPEDEIKDQSSATSSEEQYILQPLYDRLSKNQSIEDLKTDEEFVKKLEPTPILSARIKAYKKINSRLEGELANLLDYSALTSKFKKVVSICTGVDVNEVDELLDGLLEAVEGQQ